MSFQNAIVRAINPPYSPQTLLIEKTMHRFETLINSGTSFTLKALEEANAKLIEELQTTGSTNAVQGLQMIQLQKAVIAIGMFSLFESILQQRLSCKNGFREAKKILRLSKETELLERFETFQQAINVLKHGKGTSYQKLITKSDSLPFQIKLDDQNFFYEGDVSEVSTYIDVDNDFVINCARVIEDVSIEISKHDETYHL